MRDLDRFQHPRFARIYDRVSAEAEARGTTEHRRRLLTGVTGQVLEIGAGNGLNFAHYPPEVSGVLALEPDDSLRAMAEQAAGRAPVPITVRAGHADALPAGDASLDVVVTSLVLCSVPDQASALAEISRVLKPGGRLHYYEHVRSISRAKGFLEDAVTPLWALIAGGCHPNRDTSRSITAAGFEVQDEDRFSFRPAKLGPASDHVLGTARKPRAAL